MIPRPYQTEAIDKAFAVMKKDKAATLVLPTGAGKTAVSAFYIKRRQDESKTKRRFLFLQHTKELLGQNMGTVQAGTGLACSVVMAKQNDWTGQVVFANVPTLSRLSRLEEMGRFTDLIIDECHHSSAGSWERIIDRARQINPGLRVLGLSATPERGDGLPLPAALGEIAYRVYIQELIDQGHLVPPRAFTVNLGVNDELAKIDASKMGADEKVAKILDTPAFNAAVVAQWKSRAANRPTVAFCSTIEHAKSVAKAFTDAGIEARCIDANTDADERERTIADFKAGKFPILTNCLLLTEGFDHPPTSCVIVLRAMIHQSTFIQALGRGMRIVDAEKFPGVIKWDCVCLDFAGAASRHAELDTKTKLPMEDVDLSDAPEQQEAAAGDPAETEEAEPEDDTYAPQLEEVDLAASQFRYTDIHGNGTTLLVSGLSGFSAVLKAGDHWAAVGREKDGELHVLHLGARTHAYAASCDFIRLIEKDDRAVGNRRWLNDPVSPGQVNALRKWGYDLEEARALTKYEASCRLCYLSERRHVVKEVKYHLDMAKAARAKTEVSPLAEAA